MQNQETIWKQYEKHIDLYKFYMDLVVKTNAFHFAISGAIVSFYFANKSNPNIQWVLLLPALLSLCLFVFFIFGAVINSASRRDVFELRDQLGLKVAPELIVLTVFLSIFSLANLLTFLGAIYVIYSHCA